MKSKSAPETEEKEAIEIFKALYKELLKEDPQFSESAYQEAYTKIKNEKAEKHIPSSLGAFTEREAEIFKNLMKEAEKDSDKGAILSRFRGLLKDTRSSSKEEDSKLFINSLKGSPLDDVEKVFIEHILQEKRGAALSALNEMEKHDTMSVSSSKDSDFVVEGSSDPLSNWGIRTRRERNIEDKGIRGHVETYAKKMMGGFDYNMLDDGGFFVSQNATLVRPTKVTNNFTTDEGASAGQHLVAISWKLKAIEEAVRGKEVFQAINDFTTQLAGNSISNSESSGTHDSYDGIVKEATAFNSAQEQTPDGNLANKIKAFQFLKARLIPTVVAIWNQHDTSAFLSREKTENEKKEKAKFLEEARRVTAGIVALSRIEDKKSQQAIDIYINQIVDYDVINPSGSKDLTPHLRTNDIRTLPKVLGRITSEYLDRYNFDAKDYEQVSKDIIKTTLEKKGWIAHLNSEKVKDQNTELPKKNDKDTLVEFFYEEVRKQNPVLYADVRSAQSSISSITPISGLKEPSKSSSEKMDTDSQGKDSANTSEASQVQTQNTQLTPTQPTQDKPSTTSLRARFLRSGDAPSSLTPNSGLKKPYKPSPKKMNTDNQGKDSANTSEASQKMQVSDKKQATSKGKAQNTQLTPTQPTQAKPSTTSLKAKFLRSGGAPSSITPNSGLKEPSKSSSKKMNTDSQGKDSANTSKASKGKAQEMRNALEKKNVRTNNSTSA